MAFNNFIKTWLLRNNIRKFFTRTISLFNKKLSISSSGGNLYEDRRYLEAFVEFGRRLFISSSRINYTPQLSSSRIYEPDILFTEAVSTFISSSRQHPTLEEREIFYTTGSQLGNISPDKVVLAEYSSSNFVAYSSSLKPAFVQLPRDYLSGVERSYVGTKNTSKTTLDKKPPVIVRQSPQHIVSTQKHKIQVWNSGKRLEVRKVSG